MATKTIVRYKPPNELVAAREITVQQLEEQGVFNHGGKDLVWQKRNGFWLDADEHGLSPELLDKLVNDEDFSNKRHGHFEVETQEVPDERVSTPSPARSQRTTASTANQAGEGAAGKGE